MGADEANQQIVFDVRSDNNVEISTGFLNFGATTRQMLNLWNTGYGIGIQASTEYFRTDGIFCWFRQGQHSDTKADPGSGGTLAMKLDESNSLTVAGNAIVNGSVGIGTAAPVSKLQIGGDITLEQISSGSARTLPANGTLLWNDGTWLRLNQNLDFSKPIFGCPHASAFRARFSQRRGRRKLGRSRLWQCLDHGHSRSRNSSSSYPVACQR